MDVKTKRDFYDRLLRKMPRGATIKAAKELTEAFSDTIREALNAGERIVLPGVGRFEARPTKPRIVTDMRTGEKLDVPASRKISFKPELGVKKMLKGAAVVEGSDDE